MPVTAAVWREAHDYHRLQRRLHALFGYGPGIVAGLEVVASDPPDTTLYIMPGVAFAAQGESLLLTKPLSFDLGQAQGCITLLMTYEESAPRAASQGEQEGEHNLFYIHSGYSLEAIPTPMAGVDLDAGVALARVRRTAPDAPIQDAADALQPQANEIDLRFRREIAVTSPDVASVAVCYVGGDASAIHGQGARRMAQAVSRGRRRVWVDEAVPLDDALAYYTLVYLVGLGSFELDADAMKALYTYLQEGGVLFMEGVSEEADAALRDVLESMGMDVAPLPEEHALLHTPNLFAALPAGYEAEATPEVWVAEQVVLSAGNYGALWNGERAAGPPPREAIRAAHEWAENLIAYALDRRRAAQAET
jgi:hypothetical protein